MLNLQAVRKASFASHEVDPLSSQTGETSGSDEAGGGGACTSGGGYLAMYGLAYDCAMRHHVLPLQVPQQRHCPQICVVTSNDVPGPFRSSRTLSH